MASPLNIRNPRAHELAQELASRRRTSITDAVVGALEAELKRERAEQPLEERLIALAEKAWQKAGPNPREVTEAERDEMWTR